MIFPNIFDRRHKDCPTDIGCDAARALLPAFPHCTLDFVEKFECLISGDLPVITAPFLDKSNRSGHTGCQPDKMRLCKPVGPAIVEDEKPEFVLYIQHIPNSDCLIFAVIDMAWTPSEKWLDELEIIEIVLIDTS